MKNKWIELIKDIPAFNKIIIQKYERMNLRNAYLNGAYSRDNDIGCSHLNGVQLPELITVPNLHTKMLAAVQNGKNLKMDNWHSCGTSHCRAGWAIALAGEAGKLAESLIGTAAAGALIITESCPYLQGKIPNWYASNEAALKDIERCANIEKDFEE